MLLFVLDGFVTIIVFSSISVKWEFDSSHFAYKVISDVTFEVVKFHGLVKALSLYQPAKEKPSLIGWTGILFIVSSNKTVSLGILAGFPPFVL